MLGETNLCEAYAQIGFTRPGGYAEVFAVPAAVLHRLPAGVSPTEACLIEPLSCVVAALERGRMASGECVGVIGAGTLGGMTIAVALLLGADRIVAVGIRDAELDAARTLGADAALKPGENPGREIDLVVDTAGTPQSLGAALGMVRRGGRIVCLGTAGEGSRIEVASELFVRGHLEVIGSLSYTRAAWVRALDLAPLLNLGRFVAVSFPATGYQEALDRVAEPGRLVGRVLLEHV
jgi:threonine dehydrogenase-like Zn-dependent dehydrogenase